MTADLFIRSIVISWLFFQAGNRVFALQDADGITGEEIEHVMHENQNTIDSLITLLMNDEETPEKVNVYIQLSNQYLHIDHKRALQYARDGLSLSVRIDDKMGMLDCYMSIAFIQMAFTLELKNALSSYESALKIARETGNKSDEMTIYRGISGVYSQLGNLDAAKDYMSHALEMAEELNDNSEISSINAYLGSMYEEDGDTAEAMIYYKNVFEIEQKEKFENASNPALICIAHYYFLLGDIDESIRFYRIAMKRFQREQDQRWLSYTHSQLAHLYFSQKKFERAEEHAINGLSIAQQFNLNKEITDNYQILISIADSMGKPQLAARYRKSYDDMLADIREHADLLNAKLSEVVPINAVEQNQSQSQPVNRFAMALMISLPVVFLLLIMGMPGRR